MAFYELVGYLVVVSLLGKRSNARLFAKKASMNIVRNKGNESSSDSYDYSVNMIASRIPLRPTPIVLPVPFERFEWSRLTDALQSHQKIVTEIFDDALKWLWNSINDEPSMASPSSDDVAITTVDDIIEVTNDYIDKYSSDDRWEFVTEKDDVKVWRARNPLGKSDETKWPCTKAQAIIDATPEELVELLLDSSRVKEYNKLVLCKSIYSNLREITIYSFADIPRVE